MTVKEAETLSGMTRANIRFYEKEGLLSPGRGANRYRDYSAEDIETLRKIKLLRSLGVTLEELRALQSGGAELCQTLSGKILELERLKFEANRAQELCRAICGERVSYSELSAQKYLSQLPPAPPARPEQSALLDGKVYNPWIRFFARHIDLFIYETVWYVFLVLCFRINITNRAGLAYLLDSFMPALLMLAFEPVLLHLFKTTAGKRLFGLYVTDYRGGRPDYTEAFARTFGVLKDGMGFGIPVLCQIRQYKAYKTCRELDDLSWEEELKYYLRDRKWYRFALAAAAIVLLLAVLSFAAVWSLYPPNRGELTMEEFAENYNQQARFYGFKSYNYLASNGQWSRRETYDSQFFPSELPGRFSYTVEDGGLTAIRYEINAENGIAGSVFPSDGSREMYIAATAFITAQKDFNMFTDFRHLEKLQKTILEANGGFKYILAGVEVTCETSFSSGALRPSIDGILIGGSTDYHYVFTMQKTN